jgi:hypothetical protein
MTNCSAMPGDWCHWPLRAAGRSVNRMKELSFFAAIIAKQMGHARDLRSDARKCRDPCISLNSS